ncbi:porin family protein [Vibrio sp. 99-70-13A1]|uniref:porin family protein n=1 Tax=Vibrio sp. 99-70-13A1 TaxID=2607601 RepID=UPI0014932F48|nr:porin family protein [Vibrio sp. 99-70-13A1]NOH99134.1 porin family protein [Vibrio sp. 99-70-13A1]
MKFTTSITAIIALITASSTFANSHYQGHRVGLGFSSGELETTTVNNVTSDLGSGIKVEYGYDFNRIVGINVSLEQNKDDATFGNTTYKSELTNYKIDADIGYAFFLDGFNIKPYGVIGLAHIKHTDKVNTSRGSYSYTTNDTSVLLGTGIRADLSMGLYTDLRFQFAILDDYDVNQMSLTVGYKF